jgi:hypothetical protein
MRKQSGFNIRVKLSDAEGHEIHQMALRENRSQSSAMSLLLREALAARRAAAAEQSELLQAGHSAKISALVSMLKGETQ